MDKRLELLAKEAADNEQKLKDAKVEVGRLEKAIDENIQSMQRYVGIGGTTGDRFKDYALMQHGKLSDEFAERYRRLDLALRGFTGQLVLVTYTKSETLPWDGMKQDVIHHEFFQCGILAEDKLLMQISFIHKKCSLPTYNFLDEGKGYNAFYTGEIPEASPLYENMQGFYFLLPNERFQKFDRKVVSGETARTLIVGDKAVTQWLKDNRSDKASNILLALERLFNEVPKTA
jgi:hypothetical protein